MIRMFGFLVSAEAWPNVPSPMAMTKAANNRDCRISVSPSIGGLLPTSLPVREIIPAIMTVFQGWQIKQVGNILFAKRRE